MASQLRRPRSIVKVGGSTITGLLSWSWDGTTLFQADTFSMEFAIGKLPQGRGADWFATQTDLDVEILLGYPADPQGVDAAELQSLFQGRVDEACIEWQTGTLKLSGRDRTADFLDNKTSEKYPNQTASQIATKLAQNRGLTPVVTETSTKVGKYYEADHVRMQDDRTEWDLLTWLAREEQFVVYVKGAELHFEPKPSGAATYTVTWTPGADGQPPSAPLTRMETARVLTVAKDITVVVRSWHGKQGKAFTRKAVRSGNGAGRTQQYVYTIPNLMPDAAQARANQILAELSRHEMRLSITGPADNALGKADVIGLSGTGTAFDQTYFPDSIARRFGAFEGYVWRVEAKNHDPNSEASL